MLDHKFRNYIRSDSLDLTPREVLQARPIVLLGVSAEAEERLRKIAIFSVFDLAMSRVFDIARRLSGTDELAAVNYAIDLFEHGRARIGSLQINPNQDLLRQDYAKLVADFGARMPHVAEWVMMSALRNATPGRLSVFSFVGRPAPKDSDSASLRAQTQDLEGVVFPDEIATWLDATGVYSDVVNKANAADSIRSCMPYGVGVETFKSNFFGAMIGVK